MTTELPRGWTSATLEELCDPAAPIIYGILQPGPEVRDGVPYVRPTEIRGDVIQVGEVRRTSPEIAARYSRASLRPGDVLLSIVGTIGKVAVVPPELDGANITQSSVRIRPGTAVDRDFVRWVLKSPSLTRLYDKHRLGTGVPRLNVAHVRELRIPVPPLNEQRRIVAKLESIQARSRRARDALDAVPPLLEKLRQSILAAAFRGDLTKAWRAKNPDVEPASELLKRIRAERRKKWEEAELAKLKAKDKRPPDDRWKSKYQDAPPAITDGLPELPETWCWASLTEVAGLQLGQRRAPEYATEQQLPYLRAANITWQGLDLAEVKTMGIADPEAVSLRPGDVVMSEASGSPTEVGKPALWQGQIPGCCFQATVLRVRSHSSAVTGEWLHRALYRNALLGDFAAMAPGVGILHLTAERMRSWPVPLAPTGEQATILAAVHAHLVRLASVEKAYDALSEQRGLLERAMLGKAFRGQLVPQDAHDEPAAAVLARSVSSRTQVSRGRNARAERQ